MSTTFRATCSCIGARPGYAMGTSLLLAGLLLAPGGCKKSSDPKSQATSEAQPAGTGSPNVTAPDAKPAAKPVPAGAAATQESTCSRLPASTP